MTQRAKPWLEGVSRRTLKDVERTWRAQEIYRLITSKTWPYNMRINHYTTRDKAFLSLLFLTAGRVREVLSLHKNQFDMETEWPEVIIIRNMKTEKIGEASDCLPYREEFPLPRTGTLKPFTKLVEDYLELLEEPEAALFIFGRQRAWQIVEHVTGKWPHWFRAQAQRFYGHRLGDVMELKDLINVANIQNITKYVKKEWREFREKLER